MVRVEPVKDHEAPEGFAVGANPLSCEEGRNIAVLNRRMFSI